MCAFIDTGNKISYKLSPAIDNKIVEVEIEIHGNISPEEKMPKVNYVTQQLRISVAIDFNIFLFIFLGDISLVVY